MESPAHFDILVLVEHIIQRIEGMPIRPRADPRENYPKRIADWPEPKCRKGNAQL